MSQHDKTKPQGDKIVQLTGSSYGSDVLVSPQRRDFLRRMAMAAAAGAGFAGGSLLAPSVAEAAPWGAFPTPAQSLALGPKQRAKNVLEIFMVGGISPWESYYTVPTPAFGKSQKLMWWTLQDGPESMAKVLATCGVTGPLTTPFIKDSAGVSVHLGPFVRPLWGRPDITGRLRMHVMTHGLLPHEAAQPFALTGRRFGSPRMAGLGAPVARAFGPSMSLPASWVIYPVNRFLWALTAAEASGLHPGSARPATLRVGGSPGFVDALARDAVAGSRTESDALTAYYANRYQARRARAGQVVRSAAADAYDNAVAQLGHAGQLQKRLAASLFTPVSGQFCGLTRPLWTTRMQLTVATHLLTRSFEPARHVTVIDPGFVPDGPDVSYDSHRRHNVMASRNLIAFWQALTAMINKPGEQNPDKISLEDTMIVINTEFGRTPWVQATKGGTGRNHYPNAYVTLMFGGPIGKSQQGIVGRINGQGQAVDPLQPAETRAASLFALGIWPFAPNTYAVSDVPGAGSEVAAATKLRKVVLGVS